MSRYQNETPLPEKVTPGPSIPSDDRLARLDEAPRDRSERAASAPASSVSFVTILLRALSAWSD